MSCDFFRYLLRVYCHGSFSKDFKMSKKKYLKLLVEYFFSMLVNSNCRCSYYCKNSNYIYY
jgi:hypothetical protein